MMKIYNKRFLIKIINLIGFFFLSTNVLQAQYTIKGRVIDYETKEGIKNVNIIQYYTTNGGFSDSLGFFTLKSNSKYPNLLASYVGYKDSFFQVSKENMKAITISLTKNYYLIGDLDLNPDYLLKNIDSLKCDSSYLVQEETDSGSEFMIVEELCSYPGGFDCFNKYFLLSLQPHLVSNSIKPFGELEIYFTIDQSGKASSIMLNKEIPDNFLKVIKYTLIKMEKWKPATQRGENVPITLILKLHY